MTAYSYSDLVTLAQQNGFTGGSASIIAAIAMAESSGNSNGYYVNSDGSIDRGLLQINNKYHSEVSDACAYDAVCAMKQAFRISNGGVNFNAWVGYTNGNYQQYIGGTTQSSVIAANTSSTSGASVAPPGVASVLSGIGTWLINPMRLIKLFVGVALLLVAIYMLVAPQAEKIAEKLVGEGTKTIGEAT